MNARNYIEALFPFEFGNGNCGQICLEINGANGENLAIWSGEKTIGGFTWYFMAEKIMVNMEPRMRTSIRCNLNCSDKLWMVKASIILESTFQKMHSFPPSINKREEFFFNGSVLYLDLMDWTFDQQGMSVEKKFIQFQLNVLHSKIGIMPLDTDLKLQFPKNDGRNNEKIVTVNKFALAAISSYFRNLFFGIWSERSSGRKGANLEEENLFTIKEELGFDANAFSLMVYMPMALGMAVEECKILEDPDDFELVLKILKLSIKYDMQIMQQYCEKFLMGCNPKMELLEVAETLGLHELKEHVLNTITPDEIGENFGRNAEIRARLAEETRKELDRRLAEKGATNRKRKANQRRQNNKNSKRCYWPHPPSNNPNPNSTMHPQYAYAARFQPQMMPQQQNGYMGLGPQPIPQ